MAPALYDMGGYRDKTADLAFIFSFVISTHVVKISLRAMVVVFFRRLTSTGFKKCFGEIGLKCVTKISKHTCTQRIICKVENSYILLHVNAITFKAFCDK